MRRTIYMLAATMLALTGALMAGSANARFVPPPCGFVTGGGWVLSDPSANVNFGAHGGCKTGAFWGNVNVLDHTYRPPGRLKSTEITGYLMDAEFQSAGDICGIGEV